VLRHRQVQRVVGHVVAGIEHRAAVTIDDEELVGLHRLARTVAQIGEHQALVRGTAVEFDGHGARLYGLA
jgi:hypothetical protein